MSEKWVGREGWVGGWSRLFGLGLGMYVLMVLDGETEAPTKKLRRTSVEKKATHRTMLTTRLEKDRHARVIHPTTDQKTTRSRRESVVECLAALTKHTHAPREVVAWAIAWAVYHPFATPSSLLHSSTLYTTFPYTNTLSPASHTGVVISSLLVYCKSKTHNDIYRQQVKQMG